MLQKSVELYDRISAETGYEADWRKVGSLRLACSNDRMLELHRLATMAQSFGLELHVITPREAKELFPYLDIKDVQGAAYIPSDGYVDPAGLAQAIAAGARKQGADIRQGVEVLDFDVATVPRTGRQRVTAVRTASGTWTAEQSITIASGMWSKELGRKLGLSIPSCAVEHQYIVTEPIEGMPRNLPTLRDPDRLVYYKPDAGGRLLMGGYEHNTVPFGEQGIPGPFVRQLLPENHERFAPLAELATKVTPVVGEVGVRTFLNGPIPSSADGDFVLGRPAGFDNVFVAAGIFYGIAAGGGAGEMMAEWILRGEPSLDLWPSDIRRFSAFQTSRAYMYPRAVEHYAHHYKLRYPNAESESARNLRRSPLHDKLAARGAVFGSKNGWERPLWFAPAGVAAVDQLAWLSPGWKAHVAEEHRAVRERVALIDQTSFAKFELVGPGALADINALCVSNMDRPVGSVIYTQLCNDRGGIEADLTITRLADNHFYIVTGASFGLHDSDWIRRHIDAATTVLVDVTSAWSVINLAGPLARDVLAQVAEEDVSNASFPFGSMRQLHLGAAPVRALRIGYVGELGWELHIPTEFAAYVFELLEAAGAQHGIANVGYRAIESCRLEKGYLYWSSDINSDSNPYEAGLGPRVHLKSKKDFKGRAALERHKESRTRQLCTFVCDQDIPVFGGETIFLDGNVVSLATSAGFGFTTQKTIMYGYLPVALDDRTNFEVGTLGSRYPITKVAGPLYDPDNSRLKA